MPKPIISGQDLLQLACDLLGKRRVLRTSQPVLFSHQKPPFRITAKLTHKRYGNIKSPATSSVRQNTITQAKMLSCNRTISIRARLMACSPKKSQDHIAFKTNCARKRPSPSCRSLLRGVRQRRQTARPIRTYSTDHTSGKTTLGGVQKGFRKSSYQRPGSN